MTSFSVLICTYNRHELLGQALRALIEHTETKPDQVVIVNGGDERADGVVSHYQNCPEVEVTLIRTINRNLAASRNVGLPYCKGEIVAMTDDDAEVYPDWVSQIKRIHAEHPEAGAVGGAIIGAQSETNFISRVSDVVTFASPDQPGYVRTLPGVNVAYKRAALEKIGLQDESLFRGEDVDFNWRLKQAGYEVYYHPDIKVLHQHRPTVRKFLHQHYMYGRAYYLVRRKWPEMYCIYPHHFRRARDYLKALNAVAAILYEPLLAARHLPRWSDKIRALPLLIANQLAWKGGMVYQKWLSMRAARQAARGR